MKSIQLVVYLSVCLSTNSNIVSAESEALHDNGVSFHAINRSLGKQLRGGKKENEIILVCHSISESEYETVKFTEKNARIVIEDNPSSFIEGSCDELCETLCDGVGGNEFQVINTKCFCGDSVYDKNTIVSKQKYDPTIHNNQATNGVEIDDSSSESITDSVDVNSSNTESSQGDKEENIDKTEESENNDQEEESQTDSSTENKKKVKKEKETKTITSSDDEGKEIVTKIQNIKATCNTDENLCSEYEYTTCVDTDEGYTCECMEGYLGNPLEGKECGLKCDNPWGNPCGPENICHDSDDGHTCEILDNIDGCPVMCSPTMYCAQQDDKTYECVCKPGYYQPNPYFPCREIGE